MKKAFVNPAVRVVKLETGRICEISGGLNDSYDPNKQSLAPTRHGVFGEDSEF